MIIYIQIYIHIYIWYTVISCNDMNILEEYKISNSDISLWFMIVIPLYYCLSIITMANLVIRYDWYL